jgi:hypothetical protein
MLRAVVVFPVPRSPCRYTTAPAVAVSGNASANARPKLSVAPLSGKFNSIEAGGIGFLCGQTAGDYPVFMPPTSMR